MNDNNRIQVSTNFYLDEFIDPYTYLKTIDKGRNQIDKNLFQIAQKVRNLANRSVVINTWWKYYIENKDVLSIDTIIENIENSNSYRKWSGLRTNRCNIGSSQSAHKQGKAIDCVGNGKELFKLVEDNAKEFYELGVRRLEDYKITPTWLHIDTLERNTEPNSIRVVDLTKATKIIRW